MNQIIMEEIRDDPHDVLALLNSLGFVGVTASQLKAFMKDLKMHRKIKERERQQWKEYTTKKILTEQERMLDNILRETATADDANSIESISDSSNTYQDESPLVRIRVHPVSEIDNKGQENDPERCTLTQQKRHVRVETVDVEQNCKSRSSLLRNNYQESKREKIKSNIQPKHGEVLTSRTRGISTERNSPQKSNRQKAPLLRPLSAPVFTYKETATNVESSAENSARLANCPQALSRCTTNSQPKSFIRPWSLQAEAQKKIRSKKSDPVSLYQKYQQEWKQISFPGEDQHTRLRWAIREKMLGIDPNPKPAIKKSLSSASLRKR